MLRRFRWLGLTLLLGTPVYAQDKAAEVDRIFAFATSDSPGCAAAVSQDGTVIVNRAYGLADVDRRIPLSQSSLFDIGSSHKQFVAAAVLLLVEDKRLTLSDDVRKYIPELPDYGRKITIDNLLMHTGGLRDWPALIEHEEDSVTAMQVILRQRGVNFAPGEEWAYSSSGYELAKEIVARVSGMSFAEFARKRLFEPLGMKSSAYVPDIQHAGPNGAVGYRKEGAAWKPYMRLGRDRAGGGIVANIGDLIRWNDALMNGRLGKSVTDKLMEQARLRNGRTLRYARGLHVDRTPGGTVVSHSGGSAGFGTYMVWFPDFRLSVAVSCNADESGAGTLGARVAEVFLPPLDPNAKQPARPVAVAGVDVTGRAGTFFNERTGEPITLAVDRGRLTYVPGGLALVPVSQDRFRVSWPNLHVRSQDDFELHFPSPDRLELKSMEGQVTRYRRPRPYTPTAAELESFDGRYHNAEVGPVLEIVHTKSGANGAGGLVLRFERTPGVAAELTPVERDTWSRDSWKVIRFLRDGSGKVVGMIDYGSPAVRNIRFTRVGNRSASSAPIAAAGDAAVGTPAGATQAPRLEHLTGEYEVVPGRTISVTLENGQLQGALTGGAKLPLVHTSGAIFAVGRPDAPVTLTFELDGQGRATGAVMRQNGQDRPLKKIR